MSKMKTVQITIQELGEKGITVTLEDICRMMEENDASFDQILDQLYGDELLQVQQ